MEQVVDFVNGKPTRPKLKVIDLHESGFDTYNNDTIITGTQHNKNEVVRMDDQTKEYIDQRIDFVEKTLDQKFEYQQQLFSEKLDHLSTKLDKSVNDNFYKLKDEIETSRKEDRKFYITTAVALAALVVGVLQFVF